MKHTRALGMLALGLGLAGCTNPIAAQRARMQPFVGQKENVLIAVMGVPTGSITKSGVTYLTYERKHPVVIPGLPTMPPYYGPGGELSWNLSPSYFPEQVVVRSCETTFALSNGIVESLTVRGDGCG